MGLADMDITSYFQVDLAGRDPGNRCRSLISASARVSLGVSEMIVKPAFCFSKSTIRCGSDCQIAGTPAF